MTSKPVHIVGVPLDHGAGRRGVNMGPSAIRVAGLHDRLDRLGYHANDRGDLVVPAPETTSVGAANARYLPLIAQICRELCETVDGILTENGFPLVLGGDHSIAIGTISGIARALHRQDGELAPTSPPKLGVIWFDAHGDINRPETSPSGNIHGMPVSCLLGDGPDELTRVGYDGPKVHPGTFVQVGLRDIDNAEKLLLRESGITVFTMADVDRRGLPSVMAESIAIATNGTDMLHCSFDIDGVDPLFAPGTGTPKLGGLTYREAHLALEMIAETGLLTSMEMVEVNPTLDIENKTAALAVEFIASALGERIL